MANDNLKALVDELRPDVTVHQLANAYGIDYRRLRYLLNDRSFEDLVSLLKDLSRALNCDLLLVVQAFAADIGLPWGAAISEHDERKLRGDERHLMDRYRQLHEEDKISVQRMLEAFVHSYRWDAAERSAAQQGGEAGR